MAVINPSYPALTALTVTNLHSINDGVYWESDDIANATREAVWLEILVTIVTTTTVGDVLGYCDIYLAGGLDGGTDFAGRADGVESAYAPAPGAADHAKNLRYLGRMAIRAEETTARTFTQHFIVPAFTVPRSWAVVIDNETGTAIASSGNLVEYTENTITSV